MSLFCKRRPNTLPVLILLLLSLLLLFHAQYSFCQSDEVLYPAMAHRFLQGDRLLADEWHPVQFYIPLLMPFYALFQLFSANSDGIVLYFRLVYLLFAVFSSLHLYYSASRNAPRWLALCASSLCLLYSRSNIFGPSYYNLFLMLVLNGLLCLGHAHISKTPSRWYVLTGLIGACAVLANPYAAPVVILALGIAILRRSSRSAALTIAAVLAASGLLYIVLFLIGSPLEMLLTGLKYLSYPDHTNTAALNLFRAKRHLRVLYQTAPGAFRVLLLLLAGYACYVIVSIYQARKHHQPLRIHFVCSVVYAASVIGILLLILRQVHSFPCYLLLLAFAACMSPLAVTYAFSHKHKLPILLYLIGWILSGIFFFSSNTNLDAMTIGACMASMGALLMLPSLWEMKAFKHALPIRLLALILIVVVLVTSAAHRIFGFYRDAPMSMLNTRLESGPGKGLITTQETARQYHSICQTIDEVYAQFPDAGVLHSRKLPWAYMMNEWECASPMVWAMPLSSPMLEDYYALHPEKEPSLVFIYHDNVIQTYQAPFNNHKDRFDYNFNDLDSPFYLDYVLKYGTVIAETEYVTVYRIIKGS